MQFEREGSAVIFKVDTHRGDKSVVPLKFETGSELYASLLRDHLANLLAQEMVQARREAYEDGYRHGRAKKGKRGWFSGVLKRV